MQVQTEEDIVFNAVQDYLNENRVLEKNNLVNYLKSYFSKISVNINEEGIIKNIESLIKKNRIVEGSKLTKKTIMNNEKRKIVYEFIENHPGTYFNEIVKKIKSSNHVIYWHLNLLIKFNLIRSCEIQNHEIYFTSSLEREDAKKLYLQRKKESKKILDYLEKNRDGINKSKLAVELDMHPKTIKKYIEFLKEFGFIEEKKYSAKEILYFLK